jgi:hypothetical protein
MFSRRKRVREGVMMADSTVTYERQSSPEESGRTDRAGEAAGEAKDQARQVAGTASEKSREVAETAAEKSKEVAEAAKTQVVQVGQKAMGQAHDLVEDAKQQIQGQARVQTELIAAALRRLEQQARALLEGRADEAGPLRDYAGQATDQLARFAERTHTRGLDGLVQDLQRFGRNQPGPFLAGAAAAGFVAARLWRSGAVSQAAQASSPGPTGTDGASDAASSGASPTGDGDR